MSTPLYAGIDVSKDWCDVALEAGSSSARFDQTEPGRRELIGWLRAQAVTHAVLEASARTRCGGTRHACSPASASARNIGRS